MEASYVFALVSSKSSLQNLLVVFLQLSEDSITDVLLQCKCPLLRGQFFLSLESISSLWGSLSCLLFCFIKRKIYVLWLTAQYHRLNLVIFAFGFTRYSFKWYNYLFTMAIITMYINYLYIFDSWLVNEFLHYLRNTNFDSTIFYAAKTKHLLAKSTQVKRKLPFAVFLE